MARSFRLEKTPPGVRPFVRLWARVLDLSVPTMALVYCLAWSAAGSIRSALATLDANLGHYVMFIPRHPETVAFMLALLVWIPVESVLLSRFGTTPGKWLLRVSVAPAGGGPVSFSRALRRSFLVWWRGLGAGILGGITMLIAEQTLRTEGATSWDRDTGFEVHHSRIGPLRILAVVAWFAVLTQLPDLFTR